MAAKVIAKYSQHIVVHTLFVMMMHIYVLIQFNISAKFDNFNKLTVGLCNLLWTPLHHLIHLTCKMAITGSEDCTFHTYQSSIL